MKRRKPEEGPSFRDFVLAELRCAHIKARMLVSEIETIGIGVRGNFIEPAQAIGALAAANALEFLSDPNPREWTITDTAVFRDEKPPVFLAPVHWPSAAWENCIKDRVMAL